jgi:hypothetical protein
MDDRRILQAHREASTAALRELEQFAATRIRQGGIEDRDRVTGNLVGAAFLHTSSRALDPQLHTHFVLFNGTWDSAEHRWKALQTSAMFDAIHYGTAVYRNELARRLHLLGYSLRRTGSAFEIEGVSRTLIDQFSKRSKERDAAVARAEQRLGRKLSRNEIAHIVHQTRPKKIKGATDDQVRQRQLGEIGFFEKRALRKVVEAANGQPRDVAQRVTAEEAIEHGVQHVFERQSVARQHQLLEAALVNGCGQLDLAQLKERLAERSDLVHVGAEFSTRDILTKELWLIRTVNDSRDSVAPITHQYDAPDRLGTDQRQALAHVLTSCDRFTGFRGLAGTGKSTVLGELARVLDNEGFEPVFCAPTAAAADTLRKDNLPAATLARLLVTGSAERPLSRRSVIVLDEAGAVGLDDMVNLFKLAVASDARVVLSGDTGQHASVARGDALRILEQYSAYRFSELRIIRRQKPEAFRQVVKLAATKQPDKAFAKLVELGAVTEMPTENGQLYQRAADAYLSATKQGRSALLVSPTWAEIEAVTEKVRDTLKSDGVVGQDEQTLCVFDSLSWTEAEKKNASQYEPGQRLRFVRKTKAFDRGETVEVVAVVEDGLRVRRADGTKVDFIPHTAAAAFDVGVARELKVAAGDWLLLQANAPGVVNGERVQVREISGGRITLADGRTLPGSFNAFTHGYAVTSHSSQSKTVDDVLLVASSRSFGAVNREQFYVSISRGRERVQVFTDDTELLARRLTDSHERKAAVELQALRDDLAQLGFLPRQEQAPAVRSQVAKEDNLRPWRIIRPIRATRTTRTTRLSPMQRFAHVAEEVRRWISERFGVAQTEVVTEKITPAESVKPVEKVTPRVKTPETPNQKLRRRIAQQRQQPQQRRSHGISL